MNSDVDEENDDLRVIESNIPRQNFVDLVNEDDENTAKHLAIPEEFIVELHSSSNQHHTKGKGEFFESCAPDGFGTPMDKSNSIQIDDVVLDS